MKKKPLAIDVIAQAIRGNPRTLSAGELAERYIRALNTWGYVIITDRTDPRRAAFRAAANGEVTPGDTDA